MDAFNTFFASFSGIILGAILIKAYMYWEERRERAKLKKAWDSFLTEVDELNKEIETKPTISDPPAGIDRPV